MHRRFASRTLSLFAAVLALAGGGCDTATNVILIELYSEIPSVERIRITVSEANGLGSTAFPAQPLPNDQRDLRETPARIRIDLGVPASAIVRIVGESGNDRVVATRCYNLDALGVIQDSVVLTGPIGGLDADGDGFVGNSAATCKERDDSGAFVFCNETHAHVCDAALIDDCNDDPSQDDEDSGRIAARIYPNAPVTCQNGIDDDCDGDTEESCADRDGDGAEGCPGGPNPPPDCDCNDDDDQVFPGATERCDDGVDQNCDGIEYACNRDGDDFCEGVDTDPPGTEGPGAYDCPGGQFGDCNDDPLTGGTIFPGASERFEGCSGAECCNGVDENCNGLIDELPECLDANLDGDAYDACTTPGQTDCDCNDCDPGINPGQPEICANGADEDCDGMADEGCPLDDADGDGYGASEDCDDSDPYRYPNNPYEFCGDGVGQDCNGSSERACPDPNDTDGDGWIETAHPTCGDDPMRAPGPIAGSGAVSVEVCDSMLEPGCVPSASDDCQRSLDEDCDGVINEVLEPLGAERTGCILDAGFRVVDFFSDEFSHCGGCRLFCDFEVADRCVDGVCDCSTETGSIGACTADAGGTPYCCGPGTGCVDLSQDEDNCGVCGNQCGDQETCEAGVCTCGTTQATGATEACVGTNAAGEPDEGASQCCSGTCFDIDDRNNCGSCGVVCGNNSACDGALDPPRCGCVDSGGAIYEDCNGNGRGSDGDGCEIDTTSNRNHCSGCNVVCNLARANEVCVNSMCRIGTCENNFADCDSTHSTGCEINTQNDARHCNGCGNQCVVTGATAACSGGTCGIGSCNPGRGDCTAAAGCETNTTNTNAHCGACGNNCGPNATCSASTCVCNSNFANCDGSFANGCEVDLRTTAAHCGACNNNCGQNATCGSSACMCTAPFDDCTGGQANGCETNLTNTVAHCGSCGFNCGVNSTCSGSTCGCQNNFQDCAAPRGCESDRRTDEDNCGSCGNSCGVNAGCSGSSCSCDTNFQDCDASTGCESNRRTDNQNCGSCGNNCGVNASCVAASCSCATNFADCDASAGCETNTQTSDMHCGGCAGAGGMTCSGGRTCQSGSCSCPGTQVNCGGTCRTQNDMRCGASCEDCTMMGGVCNSGACQCPGGETECGGNCVDTDTNDMFCGNCVTNCVTNPATDDCVSGSCECGSTGGPCTGGRQCQAGACVCPGSQLFCGGTCVPESPAACGVSCANCVTDPQSNLCDSGTCVCGSTGGPCDAGETCTAGTCG